MSSSTKLPTRIKNRKVAAVKKVDETKDKDNSDDESEPEKEKEATPEPTDVKHKTDGLNVRDVDAEGTNRVQQTGRPKVKDEAIAKPRTTDADFIAPQLELVNWASLLPSRDNCYLPDFTPIAHLTMIQSTLISMKKAFEGYYPAWEPAIFNAYAGMLYYIQVLRSKVAVRQATSREQNFLRNFVDKHSLESLVVPAPLDVFIKTICASQVPDDKRYDYIYPSIDTSVTLSRHKKTNEYEFDTHHKFFCPNLIDLVNFIRESTVANNNQPRTHEMIMAAMQTRPNCKADPAFCFPSYMTEKNARTAKSNACLQRQFAFKQLPDQIQIIDMLEWFDQNYFQSVFVPMNEMSKFFKGSTSMNNLSPINGEFSQYLYTIENPIDSDKALNPNTYFEGTMTTSLGVLTNPTMNIAALTTVNTAKTVNDVNLKEVTHIGSFWNDPVRNQVMNYNPSLRLYTTVNTMYLIDPVKPKSM